MSDIVDRLLSYADDAADPFVPDDDITILSMGKSPRHSML